MMSLVPGTVLGRYDLLLPIGKGGMAQVWAARLQGTRGFQKLFAIKTIDSEGLDSTRMERMFLEEATIAAQIHHPNVVGTLELGEQEGMLYLVMEWVHGEPLSVVLQQAWAKGSMPLPIAVNLIGQACKGLHAAHELRDEAGELLGVVHRDVSPQNVLVSYSGTAKLVDFGIAKINARSSGLTEQGEVKGKFAYMSPEQVCGQPVDRRSDIFSMGVLLYALTTGKHPFRAESPGATVRNICAKEPPRRPSELIVGYPEALERVVMKALCKSADGRYATAHELLAALESAQPDCLDASFEAQVATYLQQLFGARAAERMNALRRAQQAVDLTRLDGPSSSSGVSSLGAVAVAIDSSRLAVIASGAPQIDAVLEQQTSRSTALVRASRRAPVVALLGACSIALALALAVVGMRRVQAPSGAASGLVEAPGLAHVAPAPRVAAAAASAAASPAASVAAPEAPPRASVGHPTGNAGARPLRALRPSVTAVLARATATTAPPTPNAPSPSAQGPAPRVDGSARHVVNAWDDANFGGRH